MFEPLAHRAYARLFSAQVIALLGTGLLTVALGLLAYDLAGAEAGAVLGTALTIKMVAYVCLAPLADALAARLPRKAVLIGADLIRAGAALALPFIDAVWQIYLLVFVLQAASAAFTPAFQAAIPDILPDEADYTRALSLSRLAYDLEQLASPALAGALLTVIGYHWLFAGTVVGFLGSALLVAGTALPPRAAEAAARGFADRLTRGLRIYLATPRLRGLMALNLVAASAGAFVIVNTVVIVRAEHGGGESAVAIALGAFGAGSMAAALVLPRLLERVPDRGVMTGAALLLALSTLGHAGWRLLGDGPGWAGLLVLWVATGALYAGVLTPSGRLLRRSAHPGDRPALFAAQFALSHACWLVAYPLAGLAGAALGFGETLAMLGALALLGAGLARLVWPRHDPERLMHDHPDLPPDHPHLAEGDPGPGRRHAHVFVIDDEHRAWPTQG